MYMCIYPSVLFECTIYVFMCIYYTCMPQVEARDLLYHSLPYSLRVFHWTWSKSQQPFVSTPECWDYRHTWLLQVFKFVEWSEPGSSCLRSKSCYPLSHLSSPSTYILSLLHLFCMCVVVQARDQTQATGFDGRGLYLLSHLGCPSTYIFSVIVTMRWDTILEKALLKAE